MSLHSLSALLLCAAATRQWNCWAGGWHETCFMSPVAALTHNKRNVFSVGRLRDCLDIVSIMSAIMVSIFSVSNFLLLSTNWEMYNVM